MGKMYDTVDGPAKSESPVDRWWLGFQPSFRCCRISQPYTVFFVIGNAFKGAFVRRISKCLPSGNLT